MKILPKSVVCPGGKYRCRDYNTCCRTPTGRFGCCPIYHVSTSVVRLLLAIKSEENFSKVADIKPSPAINIDTSVSATFIGNVTN